MVYQTRRERRLAFEEQQREQSRRRVQAFFGTVLLLTMFFVVTIFIGTRNQTGDLQLGETATAEPAKELATQAKTPIADRINQELPSKLAEINTQLQISNRTNLADIPSSTATGIAAIDLSKKGRGDVAYNADTQFTSASTYKIFVAYAMIHDVETGQRTWNSSINGTTWDVCLTKMIVNSDNACPEAYISSSRMGFTKFNQLMHDQLGVSEQTRFHLNDMRTSASDLALVLTKLYRGELMTSENRDKLYDLMKQQIYREGIPTGLGDSGAVADKVGFMNGLLHDAGIVFADQGDYVMVIMTNGESWSYIAKVAEYVNSMYNSF
ncbi:MAG: serine hydrolase [Candidatus Saccharibacteria bacterium]|nr:serine hydrolase [Candidatus Saccharibacteria bacterium]